MATRIANSRIDGLLPSLGRPSEHLSSSGTNGTKVPEKENNSTESKKKSPERFIQDFKFRSNKVDHNFLNLRHLVSASGAQQTIWSMVRTAMET